MRYNKKFKHEQKRKAHRILVDKKETSLKNHLARKRKEIMKERQLYLERRKQELEYVSNLESELTNAKG